MSFRTRMPVLHFLLTGECAIERKRALEDLKVAQAKRQTQAEHKAFLKARALTNEALKVGA